MSLQFYPPAGEVALPTPYEKAMMADEQQSTPKKTPSNSSTLARMRASRASKQATATSNGEPATPESHAQLVAEMQELRQQLAQQSQLVSKVVAQSPAMRDTATAAPAPAATAVAAASATALEDSSRTLTESPGVDQPVSATTATTSSTDEGRGLRRRKLAKAPKIPNRYPCRLNPLTSKFLPVWDTLSAFILIYIGLSTPYEISFMDTPAFPQPLFFINRVIDAFFVMDMVLQFFIMVPRPPQPLVVKAQSGKRLRSIIPSSKKKGGYTKKAKDPYKIKSKGNKELITSFKGIAFNYLTTWFALDLVSVLSGWIPLIEVLRTARCLRLLKLVRLVKSSRTFERLKAFIALDYSVQTILGCLITYLVSAHWFACLLAFIPWYAPHPIFSFLGAKGYCIQPDTDAYPGNGLQPGHTWHRLDPVEGYEYLEDAGGVYCKLGLELWVAMYYWMIMLISGASGGDTNMGDMLPGEQCVMTLIVICAALLWTYVIANFVDTLANMNPQASLFRHRMDNLNRYCRHHHLDKSTRLRLREYMYRAHRSHIEDDQRKLIQMMSPKLQAELQLQVNGRWLASVPFLQGAEEQCLLRIALALRTRVFVPNEVLPADSLYNLVSGSCTIDGSLIVSGSTWGEDCILYRTDLREEAAAAASYAEVSCIHRDALIEIVNTPATTEEFGKEYPIASRRLRWAALGIAIKGLARKNAAGDRDSSGGGGSKRYQRGKWFGTAGSGRQGSSQGTMTLDRLAEPPPQQKAADWVARSEQQARSEHYRDSQEVYPDRAYYSGSHQGSSRRRRSSASGSPRGRTAPSTARSPDYVTRSTLRRTPSNVYDDGLRVDADDATRASRTPPQDAMFAFV